jgi:hypothetical protein
LTKVDETAGTVTLDGGEVFVVPGDYEFADLQVGDPVTITYTVSGSERVITAIRAVDSQGGASEDSSPGSSDTTGAGNDGANQ